jgi:ribosomal protein S15P/S13E
MQRRIVSSILVLLLSLSAAVADDTDSSKATPEQQLQALIKEIENVSEDLASAKTDEQRKSVLARLTTLPQRLLALAEEHPNDPVALQALIELVAWVNGTAFPNGGKDTPCERALTILLRDHIQSKELGVVCQRVVFGFHSSHETFLRAVLEKNPHHEVKGLACLSLAQYLTDRLNRLDILKDQDQPTLVERYHRVFGKDYVEQLQKQDRAAVSQEAEELFARATEQYGEVQIPVTYLGSGGTIKEKAEAELFQIRNLSVGKVAPDIEGEDQDGQPFKLSDYRGKVVLLDIWHHL